MTRNATPDDRRLTLAPLEEKVDHVRGSPTLLAALAGEGRARR